jgi:hypothetical protein
MVAGEWCLLIRKMWLSTHGRLKRLFFDISFGREGGVYALLVPFLP